MINFVSVTFKTETMPPKLKRCVLDVMKSGKTQSSAYAICTASLQKAGVIKKSTSKKSK